LEKLVKKKLCILVFKPIILFKVRIIIYKKNFEVPSLINIKMFVPGVIADNEKVIVDIGTGYYVQMVR
jgi:hypothetical protein